MAAQMPIPENRPAELEKYGGPKIPDPEPGRFLCVWLRAERGMPAGGMAAAVGFHEVTARAVQRDSIARGAAAFGTARRGGRRSQRMAPGGGRSSSGASPAPPEARRRRWRARYSNSPQY
jgi:hypothetical protein